MDKIVCVGKNYRDHIKELGDAPTSRPVLFLKPPSVLKAARDNGEELDLKLPRNAGSIHHECEIVLQLNQGGYRMTESEAQRAIGAVSLGLDMTRRDTQTELKKAGHPWTVSKVFLDSAVVGPWCPVSRFPDYLDVPFRLTVDGKPRQGAKGSEMITSPSLCVAYISEAFPLCAGDLIFTGTPAGVGPIVGGSQASLSWGEMHYQIRWSEG